MGLGIHTRLRSFREQAPARAPWVVQAASKISPNWPWNEFEGFTARAFSKARFSRFSPRPFGMDPRFPEGFDPQQPYGPDPHQPFGYEPDLCHLLDRHMPSDGVFLDVGAHIGHFSLYVATRPGFHGAVHAFEPVSGTFQLLLNNVNTFKHGGVINCHNIAASDALGEARIEKHATDGGQNRINAAYAGGEVIQTTRIDSHLSLPRVDFIKCDVEGHEANALRGMAGTIATHRPFVFMESTPIAGQPELVTEPLHSLVNLGYRLFLPTWLQPNRSVHPCTVGAGTRREIMALIPFAPSDRALFPNFRGMQPLNIFACPIGKEAAVGALWAEFK